MHDLAMFVGTEHYPWPHDFADEARTQGVSKAISPTAIPEIVPGETRMVFIHPRACVFVTATCMSLIDLSWELMDEHGAIKHQTEKEKQEYICDYLVDIGPECNQSKLGLTRLLYTAQQAKDLKRLEEKYRIVYEPGFFGFTFLTGIEYVAKEGETKLPEHLQGKGIEIVEILYEEDNDGTA